MGPQPGAQDAHDRVAMVGLDGFARAKADFTPRKIPTVGNAAPLLQPEARIVRGRVYYLDGAGVVRELTLASGSKQVANFPLQAQQEISFGVSPDGARLEASRFTFPPLNPKGTDITNMFLSDTYRYELLAASEGGPSRTVVQKEWKGGERTSVPAVFAWDGSGPVAMVDMTLGTQQGTQGRVLSGHAVHLDAAGRPGPVLGGPDCYVVGIVADYLLCVDDRFISYTIRSTAGETVWAVPPLPQGDYYAYVVLSPDAQSVAYTGGVRRRDGSTMVLPTNFNPEGWLDDSTLIGITGEGNQQEMALVHLATPAKLDDLGFKGEFIGVVQPPQG